MIKKIFILLALINLNFCFCSCPKSADSLKTDKTKTLSTNRNTVVQDKQLNWIEIFQDSLSNVIGGIAFALLLFGINEYIFKTKNVSGEWLTTIKITNTTHTAFQGIGIEYKIHLLQLGNQISGRGEKTKDLNPDGTLFHEYPRVKRVDIDITGYYEKNFLKPSKLYLLVKENGTQRATSASYDLTISYFKKNLITGTFISTAADSRGESSWKKTS
jgi:hypothetical protein